MRKYFYKKFVCLLFQSLQLVCGQDLRSCMGKTYVRLWNTLACASGSHLCAFMRKESCDFLVFICLPFFVHGGIAKSSCQIGLCNHDVPHFFIFKLIVCKSIYYMVVNIPVDKFFEKKV